MTLLHAAISAVAVVSLVVSTSVAQDLALTLRYQTETRPDSGCYHRLQREEKWSPNKTAIIVCDVWDLHHCLNAVHRLEEFAPRLNAVLVEARRRGVAIIHSPSDCMGYYAKHPARQRAVATPRADRLPKDIKLWCTDIPSEKRTVYPIDQTDGGEDDDPDEHADWVAKLKAMGRNPIGPHKWQSELIVIDSDRDYISDLGDEVWSILEHRGIENVILTGVHTNVCVLGRPFGLRQMARNGKNVVLMRDMTDTMYNPRMWPYVSHFTGTDRIVSHIEKVICPTITSDQLIGGRPFRFKKDTRPHLVVVVAEEEYETSRTLPAFASEHLGKNFRVSVVLGSETERNALPGLRVLDDADLALMSIHRRALHPKDMAVIRRFVKAGKPLLGVRAASHAFSLNGRPLPDGYVTWEKFDAEVFGGNYHGHHNAQWKSTIRSHPDAAEHPALTGIANASFTQIGSLYKVSPIDSKATVLLSGRVEGLSEEPVAWTFQRSDGGQSFYTSIGHPSDFENPDFVRLLLNGVYWAAGLEVCNDISLASD